jgi:hypothetical protein
MDSMNHVSLTGPEGYRDEGHEGRRKKEERKKESEYNYELY